MIRQAWTWLESLSRMGPWVLALLITGCASDGVVRGELTYDLRPPAARTPIVWPEAPDEARLVYEGQLVGQVNFVLPKELEENGWQKFARWLVGLYDEREQLLLHRPNAGFTDEAGRVYVVDAGRGALIVFDPRFIEEGAKVQTGRMSLWKFLGSDRALQMPTHVTGVWHGLLAISDAAYGHVLLVDTAGRWQGDLGRGLLKRATGLAFDAQAEELYVADTEAHQVLVFAADGQLKRRLGVAGEGQTELNGPSHLAMGREGLWISDAFNNRIQIWTREGQWIRSIGQRGTWVGQLARPKGVGVSAEGVTFVVESLFGHVLLFGPQGEFLLGLDAKNIPGGALTLPAGFWQSADGRLFVADMFGGRVVVLRLLPGAQKALNAEPVPAERRP